MKKFLPLLVSLFLLPGIALAEGNTRVENFDSAKKIMYEQIYHGHHVTLYSGLTYNNKREVKLPRNFNTKILPDRAKRVEVEHMVPAENFGRSFEAWHSGARVCIDNNGKPFKGRRCAERASREFRLMEADLHNLAPAVGSVNGARSNKRFAQLGPDAEMPFGPVCPMKFDDNRAEPPDRAKGMVARAHLYMERAYEPYSLSDADRKLMKAWSKQFPPDEWECERERRIARIQGNHNPFTERLCR